MVSINGGSMKKITKIFLVIIIFSFFITGCTSKKEETVDKSIIKEDKKNDKK